MQEVHKSIFRSLNINFGVIIISLILFIVPVLFTNFTADQFQLPKMVAFQVLVILGIAYLIQDLVQSKIKLILSPLTIPIGLWLIVALLSSITSILPVISFYGMYGNYTGFISICGFSIFTFLIIKITKNETQVYLFFNVLFIAAMIVSAYAIIQSSGFDPLSWSINNFNTGRFFSTMGNPNFLGAFTAMIIPCCLSFLLISYNKRLFFKLFFYSIFILLFIIALFITQSRGALLASAMGIIPLALYTAFVVFLKIFRKRNKKSVQENSKVHPVIKIGVPALICLVIVLLGITVGKSALDRMSHTLLNIGEAITSNRLHLWKIAFSMTKERPVLGFGPDTFSSVGLKYADSDYYYIDGINTLPRFAHNELLNISATMGLSGLLSYIFLIVVFVYLWIKTFNKAKETNNRLLFLGILGGVIAYLVQNFFSFGTTALNTIFYFFIGIQGFYFAYSVKPGPFKMNRVEKTQTRTVWIARGILFPVSILLIYLVSIPFIADIYYQLGMSATFNREPIQAVDSYNKAISIFPIIQHY
jgi:putative inorganic carbon (HCO3(-)) transporter